MEFVRLIATICMTWISYFWITGYTKGGTQLQNFQSVGLSNFAYNSLVTLTHNSYIYITTVAKNSAGFEGTSYSDKILVDLTPPIIEEVLDGDFIGTLYLFIYTMNKIYLTNFILEGYFYIRTSAKSSAGLYCISQKNLKSLFWKVTKLYAWHFSEKKLVHITKKNPSKGIIFNVLQVIDIFIKTFMQNVFHVYHRRRSGFMEGEYCVCQLESYWWWIRSGLLWMGNR